MKILFWATFLLATPQFTYSQCTCDSTFQNYYNLFKQKSIEYNKLLSLKKLTVIYTNEPLFLGDMQVDGLTIHDKGIIKIDTGSYTWYKNKLVLAFHELGHYYLNREHLNLVLNGSKRPVSIMTTDFDLDFEGLDENWKNYYFKELFTK